MHGVRSPAAILLVPVVVGGGAFDVVRYADAGAAREAIEDREVYGAFVLAEGGT